MLTTEREVEKFIEEYQRSRVVIETTVRAILNRALEYEKKFDTPFYHFTKDEALVMFKSAHAISSRSLQNSNLILKHFARWITDVNKMKVVNIYEDIEKADLEACVDESKRKGLMLSKEDLVKIQDELMNATDKAILFLLFEGVGGPMLKELTFADVSQVSRKNLKMYFRTGKIINLTPVDYELLLEAFNEDELMSFGETLRVSRVRSAGLYKIRCNALSDNDNINDPEDVERRYRFIQRRLMLISKNLGIQLTSGSIQDSGLLHYIKQGITEENLSFREFVKTRECEILAKRYDITSSLYVQILYEKFERYFIGE